jgi:5'-methylthioadenosine phosphorylase
MLERLPMSKTVLGIIGGSGVYDIAGLENARWRCVGSPWGEPSDELLFGQLAGVDMVFLPRHGRGHVHSPTSINYRANIDALKRAGATDVISVSACGSFKEDLSPGTFVIVDQFIDRTHAREKSFFGPGFVAHVSMAHPIDPKLADALYEAAQEEGISCAKGGTYLAMEGPQFSTLAESNLYRSWGCSVIGMTAMPEAKLAREAELPYALVAMVTDYDCWHEEHEHVTVDQVIRVLTANAENARRLVQRVAPKLGPERTPSPLGIESVLDTALITAHEKRDRELFEKLDAVAGRVLKKV